MPSSSGAWRTAKARRKGPHRVHDWRAASKVQEPQPRHRLRANV